jgi:hypothetical protein
VRPPMAGAVRAFIDRKPGVGGSVISSPPVLLSYRVEIGRWKGSTIHLPEYDRFYSRTTSRHRGLLLTMATSRGIPIVLGVAKRKASKSNGKEERLEKRTRHQRRLHQAEKLLKSCGYKPHPDGEGWYLPEDEDE